MDHLNASQIIHYNIPQTHIFISIYTGTTISALAMRSTLETCITSAHAVMDKHGDVYMFPDPMVFTMPSKVFTGLEIMAHSTMVPGLRWTNLVDTLGGVEDIMLQRAIYKEVHVKMYDVPSGQQMGVLDLYRSSKIHSADHATLT